MRYPMGMNPAVANEVEEQKKEEKRKHEASVFTGVLGDDPDRKAFVVKVYGIVTCQLLMTVLATSYIYSNEEAKNWVRENYWLHYVALIVGISIMCSLLCCINNARVAPRNYILLFLFTACWTYMVAGFTQWFQPSDVLTAAGLTFAMTLGLTVFACCCKMKLTVLWGIGAALSIALWPLIIFSWIWPSKILFNVICFAVVILTSIYIIFDTKLIMKKLSVDDYIIGAILLYTDIV